MKVNLEENLQNHYWFDWRNYNRFCE